MGSGECAGVDLPVLALADVPARQLAQCLIPGSATGPDRDSASHAGALGTRPPSGRPPYRLFSFYRPLLRRPARPLQRWLACACWTASPMARRAPTSTHSFLARVMAV